MFDFFLYFIEDSLELSGTKMKLIGVLIPFIFLSSMVDAMVMLREKRKQANKKVCLSYDMNKDSIITVLEMWASEEYSDPTHSISNVEFWVNAADQDNDGGLNLDECMTLLLLKSNPSATTLCQFIDTNDDSTISPEEIMNTPDDLFTLAFPYNPHIDNEAEANFVISLYDDQIMKGDENGNMEMKECENFLIADPTPGLCKMIDLDDDNLVSAAELQSHFSMMEHEEAGSEVANFIVSTFDENNDGNLDKTECENFFNYDHHDSA